MFKLTGFAFSVLSFSSVFTIVLPFVQPAQAGCVQSHVGVQVKIGRHGAQQTDDVNQTGGKACFGNVQHTRSVQVDTDFDNPGKQHQQVHQHMEGENPTGVRTPTIRNKNIRKFNIRIPGY